MVLINTWITDGSMCKDVTKTSYYDFNTLLKTCFLCYFYFAKK